MEKIYILTLLISIFRTTKNSGTGCLLFIQIRVSDIGGHKMSFSVVNLLHYSQIQQYTISDKLRGENQHEIQFRRKYIHFDTLKFILEQHTVFDTGCILL